ncbi:unnamed protein product [Rhizophagus irregularis]|nr:unnamed protein product [Rhizophagus irregularis]
MNYKDVIFEWIPYHQFNNIKELSNTTHSAKWNDGPLSYSYHKNEYTRNKAKIEVILKYSVNSQNITNEFLNEIITYYDKIKIYGISQDPNTRKYIIIFDEDQYLKNFCVKCEKYHTNAHNIWCKWCEQCQISWLKENFTSWTSENEQIDNLVQTMQLEINNYKDVIFEWIPYHKFNNIEELSSITYSAKWKDGPLSYSYYKNVYTRSLTNIAVVLKYLVDSQNITNEFLNEFIAYYDKVKIYGISQNSNTMDYVIVFNKDQYLENCCIKCEKYFTNVRYKWCKICEISQLKENFTNWTSENEHIDSLIQKMQLGINYYKDIIFEWIPCYQFNNIKELSNTAYLAKWKDGPLSYSYYKNKYTRNKANIAVMLKYLVNSQNITNESLNEIIEYYDKVKIYGISKNPNTTDYILVFNKEQYLENCCIKCEKYFTNVEYKWCKICEISRLKENFTSWTSENEPLELVDNLIQKMQLEISDYKDIIFEWIPYYQFNDIKELGNTTYLARWKDGLLYWNERGYIRSSANVTVILKYSINSQNITNEFLSEITEYYNKVKIYGISQNPNTRDYIMIFNIYQYLESCCVKCEKYFTNMEYKWCKTCEINQLKEYFTNWTSENEHIDKLIQEMQLGINYYNDTIFEWIPYYQFNNIKELSNTTYLARWKDGLLYWNEKQYIRHSANKAVILQYLINSQNITNEFLSEVCKFSMNLISSTL